MSIDRATEEKIQELRNHEFQSKSDKEIQAETYARLYNRSYCKCCGAPTDWEEQLRELRNSLDDRQYY